MADLALCNLWMGPNEATLIDITEHENRAKWHGFISCKYETRNDSNMLFYETSLLPNVFPS